MDAAGDAEVFQVDVVLPAAGEEAVVEEVAVAQVAEAFVDAHVEPNARAGASVVEEGRGARGGVETAEGRQDAGTGCVFRTDAGEDVAAVPPDAGGEDAEFAEDLGVVETDGEGDQAAERTAGKASRLGAGLGAEGGVDQGFEFVDEETGVEGPFAAAVAPVAAGGVLVHAVVAGVVDADEDDGLDEVFAGETVGGGVGAPGAAGDVGGAGIDEVLAVVEVEDGEAAVGLGAVGGGEPDGDVTVVGEIDRVELWNAAEAGVAVEMVVMIPTPLAGGIHFGLRAVEGQMLRGCDWHGGTGDGLFLVCGQKQVSVLGGQMLDDSGFRRKRSGYQRWDA